MSTISSRHSGFAKRVLPFLAVVGACAWSFWSTNTREDTDAVWTYVAIAAVLSIIMVIVLRRGLWKMADTVEYSGDALNVQRWRTKESIPLLDVKSVQWEPYIVGSVVTIELRRPSAFGAVIRFYAPDSRKVPNINNDLGALAARVKSRDSKHVA
jgi:hypothetical protein